MWPKRIIDRNIGRWVVAAYIGRTTADLPFKHFLPSNSSLFSSIVSAAFIAQWQNMIWRSMWVVFSFLFFFFSSQKVNNILQILGGGTFVVNLFNLTSKHHLVSALGSGSILPLREFKFVTLRMTRTIHQTCSSRPLPCPQKSIVEDYNFAPDQTRPSSVGKVQKASATPVLHEVDVNMNVKSSTEPSLVSSYVSHLFLRFFSFCIR